MNPARYGKVGRIALGARVDTSRLSASKGWMNARLMAPFEARPDFPV